MRILLINPPWLFRKDNIWSQIAGIIPPLGLAQVAAYVEQYGIQVNILDTNAENISLSELGGRLKSYDFAPTIIGITATTSIIGQALETARICKESCPDAKIVFGGVHPSIFPGEVLSDVNVDFVIRREGEESFYELVSGRSHETILGLSYKYNGVIVHNKDREEIPDINKLPLPAYHLLQMNKYHPALGSYKQLPGTGIVTTRGCPGRCTFCFGNYLGAHIRVRSADKIFEEIKLLHSNYNIKEIAFYDDTFTAVKSNVIEFCRLLTQSGLRITWSCFARVDFIDKQLLEIMKKSGCHQICYGIESGSEEILKNINKKISLEKAKNAVTLTKQCGIETRATFMFGSPGETKETLEKTMNFALNLDPDIALFNIVTPYPGTEMYKWADEKGFLKTKDWSKYDLSHQILELPTIASGDLEDFYKHAYWRFYGRPVYLLKRLLKMTNLTTIIIGFKAIKAMLNMFIPPALRRSHGC